MTDGTETRDDGQITFTKTGNIEGIMGPSQATGKAMTMWDLCLAVCKEQEYKHQVVDDPAPGVKAMLMGFRGEKHSYRCALEAHNKRFQIIFYVIGPENVPAEKHVAVMEFITRANYGLRMGNFEMDLNDGEIRYKNSIDLEGAVGTAETLYHLVGAALSTMDRYYDGIMRIIYGGTSARDAVEAIER